MVILFLHGGPDGGLHDALILGLFGPAGLLAFGSWALTHAAAYWSKRCNAKKH